MMQEAKAEPVQNLINIEDFKMESRQSTMVKSRKPALKNVTLDDFELQQQLGRGTFGKVYLAVLKSTAQEYAIKVIRKDVLIEYD